jgi:hypothetical protein
MSTEKLVEKVGQAISRRSFLTKLGAGALGAALGLVGLPRTAVAHGYHYFCCHLCVPPEPFCNCKCVWCWDCAWGSNCTFSCCECFQDAQFCGGDNCNSVNCSYVVTSGNCPTAAPIS